MAFSRFKLQKGSQRTTPVPIAAAPHQQSSGQSEVSPEFDHTQVPKEKRRRIMNQNEAHPVFQFSQGVLDGGTLQQEKREHMSAYTHSEDGRTRLLERDIIPGKQPSLSLSAAPEALYLCEFKF